MFHFSKKFRFLQKIILLTQFLYIYLSISKQGNYREVPRWEIFMKQELRFGLDLGRLAVEKNVWADYEQFLRVVFSCFQGQNKR